MVNSQITTHSASSSLNFVSFLITHLLCVILPSLLYRLLLCTAPSPTKAATTSRSIRRPLTASHFPVEMERSVDSAVRSTAMYEQPYAPSLSNQRGRRAESSAATSSQTFAGRSFFLHQLTLSGFIMMSALEQLVHGQRDRLRKAYVSQSCDDPFAPTDALPLLTACVRPHPSKQKTLPTAADHQAYLPNSSCTSSLSQRATPQLVPQPSPSLLSSVALLETDIKQECIITLDLVQSDRSRCSSAR